ncbi:unnamed protein product [Linum trigynum]|uniref:Uncharacterized protein n=1 Tax=Linum trigynum TaxID=586398 RepID=A0AAV2G9A6_9ROSI
MAHPSEHYASSRSSGAVRVSLILTAVFLVVYIAMGNRGNSSSLDSSSSSCQCDCDCAEDSALLDLPADSINSSYADCSTSDPEIKEEMEKDRLALLSEEIVLQKLVANESLQRSKSLLTESGVVYTHYKREAEKCIAQVETCEEARERAEAELREELKVTALWEQRALEFGWSSSGKKRVQ